MSDDVHHQIINAQIQRRRRSLPVILAALEAARPVYEKMLDLARAQLDEGNPDAAVVFAGTAMELVTEMAIRGLLEQRDTPEEVIPFLLPDWRQSVITNDHVRELYTALTGDEIQKRQELWNELKAHTDRRNALVHRGKRCSPEDAAASVGSAGYYIAYMEFGPPEEEDQDGD